MTLDEAIKHAEEVADKKEREKQKWERWLKNDSDYRASVEKVSCELCVEEHRQLAEWLKELKQLREHTRWIPVSERLPYNHEYIKNNGLFNVSDGNRSYSEYFDIYDTERFGEPTMNGFRVDRCVVAWMPLPKSYKAESEE